MQECLISDALGWRVGFINIVAIVPIARPPFLWGDLGGTCSFSPAHRPVASLSRLFGFLGLLPVFCLGSWRGVLCATLQAHVCWLAASLVASAAFLVESLRRGALEFPIAFLLLFSLRWTYALVIRAE